MKIRKGCKRDEGLRFSFDDDPVRVAEMIKYAPKSAA